jgi:Flp pilus assembly secretin CpaC
LIRLRAGWASLSAVLLASSLHAAAPSQAIAAPAAAVQAAHAAAAKPPSAHQRDQAQQAYVDGAKAIEQHDLPRALERFTRATTLDPSDQNYATGLIVARQNLVTQLLQQAAKDKLRCEDRAWRADLTKAVKLDAEGSTHNPMVAAHIEDLARHDTPEEPVLGGGGRNDAAPTVELEPRPVVPQNFHLYATRDQVAKQVYEAFGIIASIDKSLTPGAPEDTRVHFDQDGVTFAQAQQAMMLVTNTFSVPLDGRRVLVALDTKANRTAYERLAQETVYLPGLTSAEMTDVVNLAKNVFEAQQASIDESAHTMVVRAPEARIRPLNLVLTELLAGRSEVLLDVHVYEVTRTRDVTEGAELPASSNIFNVTSEVNSLIAANPSLVQQIIASGLATPGNYAEIAAALILSGQAGSTLLSQPFAYFGGGLTTTGVTLGQSAANAMLNVSDTRILDQVQLRLLDQEEGTVRVGERYPIVTSSFSNLATSSTSIAGINTAGLSSTLASLGVSLSSLQASAAATVPQVQYQDLGLTLHTTTRVQQERDISLKVDLQLSSLSGASLNGNPVLNNRQYQSNITLKPGEMALVVSSLNTQESATLLGLPFLSEIPGFRFGTNETIQKTRASLVIVITPRVVRMSHRTSAGALILLPQHS